MVANRDLRKESGAKLHFGTEATRLEELTRTNGELASVELQQGELALRLPAGGARLWKLGR
jgi:hypothetical protein